MELKGSHSITIKIRQTECGSSWKITCFNSAICSESLAEAVASFVSGGVWEDFNSFLIFKDFIYLFLERVQGTKKERERNSNV